MGLINDSLSVIIANSAITIPFSTWMMKSFFDGISINLEEAAQIDGCGVVSSIFRVVLPLSLPGLAATIIYTAVLSWSDFLFSRTFLNTEPKWTITVGVYSMIGEHGILWEEISAAAVISIMPITLLFIFMQKYLITGMTSGAVKQ
jgi:multiple sugar transport system permease protein